MKKTNFKRVVSLFVAMCVAFCVPVTNVFAQQAYSYKVTGSSSGLMPVTEVVFDEPFDSLTTASGFSVGAAIGKTGKLTVAEVSTGASVIVTKDPNNKDKGKALNLVPVKDSSKFTLKSASELTGKYSLEFKFRRNDIAEIPTLFAMGYDSGNGFIPAIKLSVNKGTSVTDGGRLYYYDKNNTKTEAIDQRDIVTAGGTRFGQPYRAGGISSTSIKYKDDHIDHYWYVVKVDVNGANNTYDLYVNGSLCVENAEFINQAGHNWNGINVPFVMNVGSCNVDYDDFKIYREPKGTTTIYANDYSKGAGSWTKYAYRGARNVPGMEGLGFAVFNARGTKIGYYGTSLKSQGNDEGKEYGLFIEGLMADDDLTIDFDFGITTTAGKYTPMVGILGLGQPGITYCMDNDKNLYYHYLASSSYEPVGVQFDDIDGTATLHVDFTTLTCDFYLNGKLMDKGRSMARATAAGYIIQNNQEFLLSFGSRNDMGTLGGNMVFDNLRISKEDRENIISELISAFAVNDFMVDGTSVKLPKTLEGYEGYNISWSSSDANAINPSTGKITKSVEETNVTLTARVTDADGKYARSASFDVTVAAGGGETWNDSLNGIASGVIGSSIGNRSLWYVNKGNGKIVYNPSNDEDQAAEINEGADIYFSNEARTHTVTGETSLFIYNGSDAEVYLADEDGKKLANVIFDDYGIRTHNGVISSGYLEESWINVELVANSLNRTYDVYLGGVKINSTPIEFVDESARNSVSRFGFTTENGKFCVDNISLSGADYNEGITYLTEKELYRVDSLSFEDKDGNAANAPQADGTIESATVSALDTSNDTALFVATYDGGKLCDVSYKPLNLVSGLNTVNFENGIEFPAKNGSYRVMLWDSNEGLKPVLEAEDEISHTPVMYIVGDRSAADYKVDGEIAGWGSAMKNIYASSTMDIINLAKDGQSLSDAVSGYAFDVLENSLTEGDILVISSAYDEKSTDSYKTALDALAEIAERNGAECVYIASDIDSYNTVTENAAKENGATVITLSSDFAPSNGYYNKQSAQYAAQQIAEGIKAVNAYFAANAAKLTAPTYTKSGSVLKISGSGVMPVYKAFSETPWKSQSAASVEIEEGITSISENAFNGLNLTSVYIPESVKYIADNAFSEGTVIYGEGNSTAQKYAEANGYTFYLKKLRVACVGNSHTDDWTAFSKSILNDLYNAGLETQIQLDIIINGGFYMYKRNHQKNGDWATHYVVAQKPGAHYYSSYSDLNNKEYDLVLIQDYRESDSATSASDFTKGIAATMRWLRATQPDATVAWIADWSHECYIENVNGSALTKYNNNTVAMMNAVADMTVDAPDFIIPMGTAVQNARSSYLGSVRNRLDSFRSFGTTDYAGGKETDKDNLTMFPLLHRDMTHSSFELGRYLVGTAVIGKIFSEYSDILEGADSINYFNALKTMPDCSLDGLGKEGVWRGHFNDNIWSIVKESASNALINPTSVTASAYTTDPADAIEAQIAKLNVAGKSAGEIVSLVKAINSDIEIETSDVVISDTVSITFVYGYTMKTVTIG